MGLLCIKKYYLEVEEGKAFEMGYVNSMRETIKLSYSGDYKNYFEGALPFRGKEGGILVGRIEKDLILMLTGDGQGLVHGWGRE